MFTLPGGVLTKIKREYIIAGINENKKTRIFESSKSPILKQHIFYLYINKKGQCKFYITLAFSGNWEPI